MTSDWQHTHTITLATGESFDVFLTDDWVAYTREEWAAEAPADFELEIGKGWTFQGRPFAGSVTAAPRRKG